MAYKLGNESKQHKVNNQTAQAQHEYYHHFLFACLLLIDQITSSASFSTLYMSCSIYIYLDSIENFINYLYPSILLQHLLHLIIKEKCLFIEIPLNNDNT